MMQVYEIGRSFRKDFKTSDDKKLKFTLFPYTGAEVVLTSIFFFFTFLIFGMFLEYLFSASILFTTMFFFGAMSSAILYIYPTRIYHLLKIMEYKREMLTSIMRFSTYLSMKSNLEYAIYNSIDYTKGILKVQFRDILLKLERKEYIDLGEAFKDYSTTWNEHSPDFVDALKLLEVATLTSGEKSEVILADAIDQIILSYNIEQKRNSEELSENIGKVVTAGILFPVMILMLIPLISVFLPNVIKASALFLLFNILLPGFLLIASLNFAAKRVQLKSIEIETSDDYIRVPKWIYILSFIIFLIFFIPSIVYFVIHDPGDVSYSGFGLETIFFAWLIPAGITIAIMIITYYYSSKNQKLWTKYEQIEDDLPHLLNYFSTYLELSVPFENIFKEVTNDYVRHGFKEHPTVGLLSKISFNLSHLKISLKKYLEYDIKKISTVKSLNEIFKQIASFSEFSLKEAAKISKRIRSQRVDIVKLNDYILTLLNSPIGLVSTTISMLAPLLSALAIIMSLFIVTFIKYLTGSLETIANMGSIGSQRVDINLIDIDKIISPVYLELIIGFYIVEIILILSFLKSNLKYGYSNFNIIKDIGKSQMGFIIFTIFLFAGYIAFKAMFASTLGMSLE